MNTKMTNILADARAKLRPAGPWAWRSFARMALALALVASLFGESQAQGFPTVTATTNCDDLYTASNQIFPLAGLYEDFGTLNGRPSFIKYGPGSNTYVVISYTFFGNWTVSYYDGSSTSVTLYTNSNNVGTNPPNTGWVAIPSQDCAGRTFSLSGSVTDVSCSSPTAFNVTGNGGVSCNGTGVAVGLSGSQSGVSYQLRRNGNNVGSPLAGTGAALSFGNQTVSGTYTVVGTRTTGGCSTTMSGSASITAESGLLTPSVAIASNLGSTIPGGTNVTFTATPTNGGSAPSYQWKKNGSNVGTNSSTFSTNTLANGDVITVAMTSNHPCTSTSAPVASNAITMSVTAAPSNALDFDGSNDAVTVADNSKLDFTNTLTLEAWIKLDAYPTPGSPQFGIAGIISKPRQPGGTGYALAITGGSKLSFMGNNNTLNITVTSADNLPLNTWTHVAATYGGGVVRVYVNGVQVATQATNINFLNSSEALRIGAFGSAGTSTWNFNGAIDEARIWNVARTAQQIIDAKGCTLQGNEAGLVAYYRFDQGSAGGSNSSVSTAIDSGPNGLNGTLTNFALDGSHSNWVASTALNCPVVCDEILTPSVSIASDDADNSIEAGTSVTFTATPTNGGDAPSYQWYVNGSAVSGATNSIFVSNSLADGDTVRVQMTSSDPCADTAAVLSNGIGMDVSLPCVVGAATWTPRTAASPNFWQGITYGNGTFVAVSSFASNQVMTSPDGINWTPRTAALNRNWAAVTYGNGRFVAVSTGSQDQVMSSPDGINWTAHPASEQSDWRAITYGNGLFVAVAGNKNGIMISPDGMNWTSYAAPENNFWTSVAYGNGRFVAVASDGNNQVMSSTDGINWTSHAAATNNPWWSVTYGNGRFVAVANGGSNQVMSSPDGINWTSHPVAENNQWWSVTYGGGLFVAVAASGSNRVMSSPDGINWTSHAAAQNNQWRSVAYGNGVFAAVSFDGSHQVMSSPGNAYPEVRIASDSPANIIAGGESVTFTATPLFGGEAPVYQWFVNGVAVSGASGPVFSTDSLADGDSVSATLISSDACANPTSASSNSIVTTVTAPCAVGLGNITVSGLSYCYGDGEYTYFDQYNGAPRWKNTMPTNFSSEYSYILWNGTIWEIAYIHPDGLFTVETAYCDDPSATPAFMPATGWVAYEGCNYTPLVISGIQGYVALDPVLASVSIASDDADNSIVEGANIRFTATPSNGGNAQAYQWYINGVAVPGAVDSIFATRQLADGDSVAVAMLGNHPCADTLPVLSNAITVSVAALTRHYVKQDASGTGDGSSWADAHSDLSEALLRANAGDTVWVAAGTYLPSTDHLGRSSLNLPRRKTFYLKDGVTLLGGFAGTESEAAERDPASNVSILSGDIGIAGDSSDNAYHVVLAVLPESGAIGFTLDGFSITGGQADGISEFVLYGHTVDDDYGAGLHAASEVAHPNAKSNIRNNKFYGNHASLRGAGLYVELYSDADVLGNHIANNGAGDKPSYGGGLYLRDTYGALADNTIHDNAGDDGAGVFISDGSVLLRNNDFEGNIADDDGGALYIDYSDSTHTIIGNRFYDNHATDGGAVFIQDEEDIESVYYNNIFHANTASDDGGAMYVGEESYTTIANNVFYANAASSDGGAIRDDGAYEELIIVNNIFWANTRNGVDTVQNADLSGDLDSDYLVFEHNLTQANSRISSGTGILNNQDPLFADAANGDFSLLPGSPAIDAGTATAAPATDIVGVARPQGSAVDLGAYEYAEPPCNCDPACSPLPMLPGTYTAAYSAVDSEGRTHYCDASGQLLLSLDLPSGYAVLPGGVQLWVDSVAASFQERYCGGSSVANSCIVSAPAGGAFIQRRWHVDADSLTGGVFSPALVIMPTIYVPESDYTALNTALLADGAPALPAFEGLQVYAPMPSYAFPRFAEPDALRPLNSAFRLSHDAVPSAARWSASQPQAGVRGLRFRLLSFRNSFGLGKLF